MKENQNKTNELDGVRISPHFKLNEFLNLLLLEPARQIVGPIIINSGFRNETVNRRVGGVKNSQHLLGQAADIRPQDPAQFHRLVDFLKANALTDQLLTAKTWLHLSWNPFAQPRHYIRLGYYK